MFHGRGRIGIVVTVLALRLAPSTAAAADELDLVSARALFLEAVDDEAHHRIDVALEKFFRVQRFKATPNVGYRIGECLEALGRFAEALAAYGRAVSLGAGDTKPEIVETVAAAKGRAAALEGKVARVRLVVPPGAVDAEVRIDDARVAPQALDDAIAVDPGHHTIAGTAKNVPPFRTSVTLPEGGRLTLTIPLDAASQARDDHAVVDDKGPNVTLPAGEPDRTPGWVVMGASGTLLVGAGATYWLRHNDIGELHQSCPGNVCPASQEARLSSVRNRAVVEETLSDVLAIAGAIGAAVGVYLVVKPPTHSVAPPRGTIRVSPSVSAHGVSLGLTGTF